MRTILLVTDIPFWKSTLGSHVRIQRLARVVARHNRLEVFFLRSLTEETEAEFSALDLGNARLTSYKNFSGLARPYRKRLSVMPFLRSHAVDDFCSALAAFIEVRPVDAVILEYIRLAYLLDACGNTPTLLDMHDVMSQRTISLRRAGLKPSIEIDARSEYEILRCFHRVLAISIADHAYLGREFGLQNALYVPCSVDVLDAPQRQGEGRKLIFVGGNTAPNVSGMRWFLDQAWPMLAEEDFTLEVVGTVCDALAAPPRGVQLQGQRDDLRPFLFAADIAINPVFVGGGLKIKCLDALAAGLPCVTTEEGAAGLHQALDTGLLVARSRLEFAGAVRYLADSPTDRLIVAALAPRFIRAAFSDEATYAALGSYLTTLQPRAAVD